MAPTWSGFERMVGSRRFAQWTLAGWALLLAIWVVPFTVTGVPEPRIARIVAGEWYFRALYVALLVNLMICLLPRWRRALAAARLPTPIGFERLSGHSRAVVATTARSLPDLADALASEGWTVVADDGTEAIAAVRRRFSPVASILMHLSLALVLVAAFLLPGTTTGQALVVEGQSFSGEAAEYAQKPVPPPGRTLPRAAFALQELRADFFEDKLLFEDLRARVARSSGGTTRTATVRLSDPLFLTPTTFVSLVGFNHALGYTLDGLSRGGRRVERELVGVNSFPPGSEDKILLRVGALQDFHWAYVRVYPDVPEGGASLDNRSFALGKPKIAVRIARVLDDSTERTIGRWVVRPGETVDFDGSSLTFDTIKYAGLFRLTDVPSLPWIAAAFVTGLVGLVWRTTWPRQELYVARGSGDGVCDLIAVGRIDYDRPAGVELATSFAAGLEAPEGSGS